MHNLTKARDLSRRAAQRVPHHIPAQKGVANARPRYHRTTWAGNPS